MRVKLSRNSAIFILVVLFGFFIGFYIYLQIPQPVKSYDYKGTTVFFRQDLREAGIIQVIPFETATRNVILNPFVKNITFVFIPASEGQNGIYLVEELEIIQKLSVAFIKEGIPVPGFNAKNVTSYENLPGKIQNPIIALVHPEFTNETIVEATSEHIVYIKGKNIKEFDLASIRFLMSIMSIKI